MKLTKERIEYLIPLLKDADYCQLAKWGKDGVDVQVDLMDAINDIAALEAQCAGLELMLAEGAEFEGECEECRKIKSGLQAIRRRSQRILDGEIESLVFGHADYCVQVCDKAMKDSE